MGLINRIVNFSNDVLMTKRRVVNFIFFTIVVLNVLAMVSLALKGQRRLAVSIFLIYFLETIFFYLVPMCAVPAFIQFQDRRSGKLTVFPRIVAVGCVLLMLFFQIGWLMEFLSEWLPKV